MIESELKRAVAERNVILFVGAGVSASLGFPTWNRLIGKLGEELGYNKRLFPLYGDNLILAEYYALIKGHNPDMSRLLAAEAEWKQKVETSPVFRAIVDLDCPIIYTTNYDHLLEMAYESAGKAYKRIVDVGDLVGLDPAETQIVKFHGDYTVEKSIVLTESSYFERLDFESPIDIKFRADALGKSILFLGYKLSDINIRLLLFKLDRLWQKSNSDNRPRSYIFLPTPNTVQERILESRGITAIVGEKMDKTEGLLDFLLNLRD